MSDSDAASAAVAQAAGASSRSSTPQLLNPQSIPASRPWSLLPQPPLSPVRVTISQPDRRSSSRARSPLASPQHTPPVSPFDPSQRRSTYRDSDSESVRSDVTIDDLIGTPHTPRISIQTDASPPSPVPRAMLSPVPPSPGTESYAPSSYEEDLFFRMRDKTPSPTPSKIRKAPPPALALVPTSSTPRTRSPAPSPSPRQSYGPPCAPPPAVALPEIPKTPSQLKRFSTQSANRLSTVDALDSPISLTPDGSSASNSINNVVVRRASRMALMSDTLPPIGVAPATYRPASTVVLIPDPSILGPIGSAGAGSTGETTAGLFQETFMLSEQSLHQPGSAVASTIAFSESGDDERSRLTDKNKSSVSPKQRPMSWGNTSSVRSTGQRIAASIWQFASGLRSPRTPRTSNAPLPPARAMNIHPDRDLDLEELAQRANDLNDMLAEGRLPNDSIRSVPIAGTRGQTSHTRSATSISAGGMRSRLGRTAPIADEESRPTSVRPKPKRRVTIAISSTFRGVASRATPFTDPSDKAADFTALDEDLSPAHPRRRRWTTRRLIIAVSVTGILLVVLLVAVIFGLRRKSSEVALCANSEMTGVLCNLNATCTCSGSDCKPLAGAIKSTLPAMNRNFNLNVTEAQMAMAMWDVTVPRASLSCPVQANLIDVGPALDGISFPNRTLWAQTALLWTVYSTLSLDTAADLKTFVATKNFTVLQSDAPVTGDAGAAFRIQSLGYTFDFAAMTATTTPLTFKDDGVDGDQLASVADEDVPALDEMHTAARASSDQRALALQTYWEVDLALPRSSLAEFVSAMQRATTYFPFDATYANNNTSIAQLFTNGTRLHVPPAAACIPNSGHQLEFICEFQEHAFDLPEPDYYRSWNTDCLNRYPVYGRLNPLRWRTPFLNGSIANQALMLTQSAKSRLLYHVGHFLDNYPYQAARQDLESDFVDAREYGTVEHLNHILLEWLTAMPSTKVAAAAAKFVVDASKSPDTAPPVNSLLLDNANQLPTIGLVFFGALRPQDVSGFVSDFSAPDGSIFFGSDRGTQFRTWALETVAAPIAWADGAIAKQYVKDGAEDATFSQIWTTAANSISNGGSSQGRSSVDTVIGMFERALYFES